MSRKTTEKLIRAYFTAYSLRDVDGLIKLLDERVIHDAGRGARHDGASAVRAHLDHAQRHFQEAVHDLVVMVDGEGRRAAAEFTLVGKYLETEAGLPPAAGQDYALTSGAFFMVDERKIVRATHYVDAHEWLKQLGARSA